MNYVQDDIERVSNGQFAPGKRKAKPRGRPFAKGNPGRPKGAKNKVSRACKDFLMELVDDPEVQAAVRERITRGDAVAFFRALEHVVGKPAETVRADVKAELVCRWQK